VLVTSHHLALRHNHQVRRKISLIIATTPPFEEGPFRLYQAYLEISQTLYEIEAWSTHQQPIHLCQCTRALRLLSAPCHRCNGIGSLCALTYRGIQDSMSSLCSSGCHIGSWLLPSLGQIDLSTTFEAIKLRNWKNMKQCILLPLC
jgi:hypothetical protein